MRAQCNRILNLLLFFCLCGLISTGLLLYLKLPRGRESHFLEVMGMGRHDWVDTHFWLSVGMIFLVAIHLALHWQWLWKVASKQSHRRLIGGLSIGFLLIALPLCWPTMSTQSKEAGSYWSHRER